MEFKLISDIPNWTIEEQLAKIDEEVAELKEAILEGDKEHIMEEILDVCQSALTATQVLKIDDRLYEGINKHNKKLKDRGLYLNNINLPYKIGDTIYVSVDGETNSHKVFHKALLLNMEFSKHNLSHIAHVVLILDVSKPFVDYFCRIYTEKEYMEICKDR
ncbi:hypothetical protein Q3304_08980 [Clostridioides sp. GD02377]|uniref:hypothetical protein n=1 Tax=unclassified Clostridioides TaxID=2635829 RepID=UPI00389BD7A2